MATAREKAIKKIEKRIVPIEEADPYLKILVYGRHGSQKTRFAATAPDVIIIDINEKGTRSARTTHGAKVLQTKTWEDVVHAYWFLATTDHPYQSVAIDGLTAMQNLCMKTVLGEAEDRDPNRPPQMPDRRAWGQLAERMKQQILDFRNLEMHVIFTALERKMGDEDEGEDISYVPDMSPGSRGFALAGVDVIGRMYMKEVRTGKKGKKEKHIWEPRMYVGPHDQFETKDRTGSLGQIVRNPTVPKVIEAAFSSEEEE